MEGRKYLAQLARGALDLLYPPRCAGCGRLGSLFCASCLAQVEPLRPPICEHCGRPASSVGLCPFCRRTPSALDGIRSAAIFKEPLRSAIHHFKYYGGQALAEPLASLLRDCWLRQSLPVDVLVPVPLHERRLQERGYNQAALLARELGRSLGLPVVEQVLHRVRETLPQVGLNARQRRENVAGAFHCLNGAMRGRSVLLIDDVCTTGATLEACAVALRQEGKAAAVWALTVARARGLDDGSLSLTGERSRQAKRLIGASPSLCPSRNSPTRG